MPLGTRGLSGYSGSPVSPMTRLRLSSWLGHRHPHEPIISLGSHISMWEGGDWTGQLRFPCSEAPVCVSESRAHARMGTCVVCSCLYLGPCVEAVLRVCIVLCVCSCCVCTGVVVPLVCSTLCNPTDCSTPDSSVLRYLPEFAQIHVQ